MKKKEYMIPLVIGVTGHRDIKVEDVKSLEEKVTEIFETLEKKYPSTPFILLSPLADGADRIVAKVAMDKFKDKITIKIPLPFNEDIYKTTFGVEDIISNDESIKKYEVFKEKLNIKDINSSSFIKMDFDGETFNDSSDEKKQQIRHNQYSLLGEYVSLHSHILIALENPNSTGKKGGTSEVVNKKLTGEYEILGEQNDVSQPEQGIVYQLNTPRLSDIKNNTTLEKDEKYKIKKLFPNSDKPQEWNAEQDIIDRYSLKDFKEHLFSEPCLTVTQKERYNSYRQQHFQINCLNKAIKNNIEDKTLSKRIEESIEKYGKDNNKTKYLVSKSIVEKSKDDVSKIEKIGIKDTNIKRLVKIRRAIAIISNENQDKMKSIEKLLLFLIVITTTIILTKSIFPEFIKSLLNFFYPSAVALFYILVTYFKKYKNIHEDTRAISEGLRVQIAWNIGKVNESVALNYLSRQKDELNWIRSSLRTLNIFSSNDVSQNILAVNEYWIEEQIGYFSKSISKYSKIYNKSTDTINMLFIVFVSLYVSFFVFSNYIENLSDIKKLYIAIPLIFLAWIKSKQLFDGHAKTIKQYQLSKESFKRAKELLSKEKTNKKEVLKNLGQEALFENSFWTILRREKNYKTPSI